MTKAKAKAQTVAGDPDDGLFGKAAPAATPAKKKNEVAVRPTQNTSSPAPLTEIGHAMAMIAQAARDPAVDIAKMRELLAMRKELAAEQAEQSFTDSMSKAQTGMRAIAADSNNSQTKSRYPSYKALDRVMRPIYTANGFSISFDTGASASADSVMVIAVVSHVAGHTRRYQIPIPADGKGAKGGDVMTKTHAVGAAMTYGQRYLLKMIFNIAVGDDDDGNSASAEDAPNLSTEQAEQIIELAAAVECAEPKLVAHLNKTRKGHAEISKIVELPSARFDEAIAALRSYESNKKDRDAAKSKGDGK